MAVMAVRAPYEVAWIGRSAGVGGLPGGLLGCAADNPVGGTDGQKNQTLSGPFLAGPSFDLPKYESGDIVSSCVNGAPWGERAWGTTAATFSDPDVHTIDGARFRTFGGVGYLFGKEASDRMGFVRFVQGDVWGGSYCGPS